MRSFMLRTILPLLLAAAAEGFFAPAALHLDQAQVGRQAPVSVRASCASVLTVSECFLSPGPTAHAEHQLRPRPHCYTDSPPCACSPHGRGRGGGSPSTLFVLPILAIYCLQASVHVAALPTVPPCYERIKAAVRPGKHIQERSSCTHQTRLCCCPCCPGPK